MKNIGKLTLSEIVENKIQFVLNNNIYDKDEFHYYNKGEVKAYNEMLNDMNFMNESEFTEKYLIVMKNILNQSEEKNISEEEKEEMTGYNNGIVDVLSCINPIHTYDTNDN